MMLRNVREEERKKKEMSGRRKEDRREMHAVVPSDRGKGRARKTPRAGEKWGWELMSPHHAKTLLQTAEEAVD